MRHGKYDLPLDNSDSTFSTGQSAMSASRSKLPVKVVKLYHSSEVQKITLTNGRDFPDYAPD
jgi:hypothetical protein